MLDKRQLSVAIILLETFVLINSQVLNGTTTSLLRSGRLDAGLTGGLNLQNGQFLQISNSDVIPVSVKREGAESWSAVGPLQTRQMTRLLVPVKRYFPVYYRIYRYPNGRIVRIPIIYRFYRVIPPGIRGAVRTRSGDGWLVPTPVFVLNREGRLVYNPVVYNQFMAMVRRGFRLSSAFGAGGEIRRSSLPFSSSSGESISRLGISGGNRFSSAGTATTDELRRTGQIEASRSGFAERVDQSLQTQTRGTLIQPGVRAQTLSRTDRRYSPEFWQTYWYRYNQRNGNIDPRLRSRFGVPPLSGTGFPLQTQVGGSQTGTAGIGTGMEGRRQIPRTQTITTIPGTRNTQTVVTRGTDVFVPDGGTAGTDAALDGRIHLGTDHLTVSGTRDSNLAVTDVGSGGTGVTIDDRGRLGTGSITSIGGQDSFGDNIAGVVPFSSTGIGAGISRDLPRTPSSSVSTVSDTPSTGFQSGLFGDISNIPSSVSTVRDRASTASQPGRFGDLPSSSSSVSTVPDIRSIGPQPGLFGDLPTIPSSASIGTDIPGLQSGFSRDGRLPGGVSSPVSTLIPPRSTGFIPNIPDGRTLFPGRDIGLSDTHTHTTTHTRDTIPFNGPTLPGLGETGLTGTLTTDTGVPILGSGPTRPTGTSPSSDGVIGVITDTSATTSETFPGGISGTTGFGQPVSTGINEESFNGQPVSPLEDPTTGLPIGFVPQDPVRIGTASEPRVRFVDETVPVTGTVTTPTTELVGVPPSLATLLNDHSLLDYLNQVLASGDVLKFKGQQDKFKVPLAILEVLTKPEVTEYLNYLITALNLQQPGAVQPRAMPTDLFNLLESQFFIDFMNGRRAGGGGFTVDVRVKENRRDPLSTFAVTMDGSNDPLIMEGMNGGIDKSDIFIPGTDESKIQIRPLGEDNLQDVLSNRGGDVPTLPVLPTESLNKGGTIIPVGVVTEVLGLELCMGCKIDGGLGYTNHPSRCDLFVVCYPGDGGNFIPMAQQCPYGLFWSQASLTCKLSKDVHCPHEVCRTKRNKYQYAHKDNCRAYWECHEGYSEPHCCPPGYGFFDGEGCRMGAVACNADCPPNKETNEELLWSGACDKRDVLGEPTKYERHVHQNTQRDMFGSAPEEWVLQECPLGTIFRKEICECSMNALEIPHYEYEGHTCKPEVFMPFENDLFDKSVQRTHVRVDNVTRTGGAACFNGRSALAIPKYANMDYGTYFYATLKYKHSGNDGQTQALLYNGDCDVKPSMVLGSKPDGNMFSVKTTTGQVHTLFVPSNTPPTDWRTVSILIDGNNIELKNDQFTETHKISGGIARSQCGMKIGWGEEYKNFVGCIDEFKLYRCRPDEYPKKRNQVFPEIKAMNGEG